jgi:membrane-associated protease RseP (regulator of RpoE activity)
MFGIPGNTEFDLKFRLLGIPVRVHPLFWAIAAFLGGDILQSNMPQKGTMFILWVFCVFLSIIVHEFGHALVSRYYGDDPNVLLYGMGGLCIHEPGLRQTWKQRLLVIIMGPGAGFLLMIVVILLGAAWLRISPIDVWNHNFRIRERGFQPSMLGLTFLMFMIEINLFWGLFNLLPIVPLDGGQLSTILLTRLSPRAGQRRAYIVSLLTAGFVAIYFVTLESYYNALLMGMLALSSFQMLQALHYSGGDSFEDESDWWKR